MKLQAFIDDEGSGSSVLFSGDWGLDANGQIAMKAFGGMTMYSTMPIVLMVEELLNQILLFNTW